MNVPVNPANDQSSIIFGIFSIGLGVGAIFATLLTILLLPCGIVQLLLGVGGMVVGFLAFTRGKKANVQPGKITGLIGVILSALATLIPIGYFIFIALLYAGLFAFGQGSR